MLHLGLNDYFLNDNSINRVKWAHLLFQDFGFKLSASDSDLHELNLDKKFSYVSVMGWENNFVSYRSVFEICKKHLADRGKLFLTFIDDDEYELTGFKDSF